MNVAPKTASGLGGAGVGGAVSIVFLWMLQSIFPHLVISNEVAQAFSVIITAATGAVASYATHAVYLPTPPPGTSPITFTVPETPPAPVKPNEVMPPQEIAPH
jgi:hypothetical protein